MKTSGPNGTGSVFASEGSVTEFRNFHENLNMAYHFQILQHFSDRLANKIEILTEKRLNVNSNRCRTSNCTTGPQYRCGISMFK